MKHDRLDPPLPARPSRLHDGMFSGLGREALCDRILKFLFGEQQIGKPMSNSSIALLTRIAEKVVPDDVDLVEPIFDAALKGGNEWLSLHRSGSKPLHGAVLPLGEPSLLVHIIDFFKEYGPTIKDVLASTASISTLVRNLRSSAKEKAAPTTKSEADEQSESAAEDLHARLTSALVAAGLKPDAAAAKSLAILQELNEDPKASVAMMTELESDSEKPK
jgi:hypothetical protein